MNQCAKSVFNCIRKKKIMQSKVWKDIESLENSISSMSGYGEPIDLSVNAAEDSCNSSKNKSLDIITQDTDSIDFDQVLQSLDRGVFLDLDNKDILNSKRLSRANSSISGVLESINKRKKIDNSCNSFVRNYQATLAKDGSKGHIR
ncbi:MAG: hypothetical protein P8P83_04380 [Rickettsiaceae bacterium]|nr:hypothetical protein [Rickettsiaceae bacterium]